MKYIKRLTATILSALMIVTSVPPITAEAVNTQKPTISFVESGSDSTKDTIVQEQSSKLNINMPKGYTLAEIPFIIKDSQGQKPQNDPSGGAPISVNMDKMFIVTSDKLLGTKNSETYSIYANFFALKAEGTAIEKESLNSAGVWTTAIATEDRGITKYSKVNIKCIDGEEEGKAPSFKILDHEGIFDSYTRVYVAGNLPTHENGKKVMSLVFTDDNGIAKPLTIKLYPTQSHIIKDKDGKDIKTDHVIKDSTYEIEFRTVMSNEIFLTVKSPQQVVNDVAQTIEQENQRSSYVTFGKGDDEDFVTQDFSIVGRTKIYHSNVEIVWSWENVNEKGEVITPNPEKSMISFPPQQDKMNVTVNPRVDDKYAKIIAKVIYKDKNNLEKVHQDANFPITIKGIGTPPETKYIYTNDKGETEFRNLSMFPQFIDVYDGNILGYKPPTKLDNTRDLMLFMGLNNSASVYAKVSSTNEDIVDIEVYQNEVNSNSTDKYSYGAQIKNPIVDPAVQGKVALKIVPKKSGTTLLTIQYYKKGKYSADIREGEKHTVIVNVVDNTPSTDASLRSLKLIDKDKEQIDFGFSPDKYKYDIQVPHSIDIVEFIPMRNDQKAKKDIHMEVVSEGKGEEKTVISGTPTDNIKIEKNSYVDVIFTVTSQSMQSQKYQVTIQRMPPSNDGKLKNIDILDKDDTNYMTAFSSDIKHYMVEVPYKVNKVKIIPTPNHKYAEFVIDGIKAQEEGIFKKEKWYPLNNVGSNKININITPESTLDFFKQTYNVDIIRKEASTDARLVNVEVTDYKEQKKQEYIPKFDKDLNKYELEIPYEVEKLRFNLFPSNENISKIEVRNKKADDSYKDIETIEDMGDVKDGILTQSAEVEFMKGDNDNYTLSLRVTAEDQKTTKEYNFKIFRLPPNNDTSLKSLVIRNDKNKEVEYDFYDDTKTYNLNVPYEVESVTFTPTTTFDKTKGIKIKANNALLSKKVKSGETTSPIRLSKDKVTQIEVTVTAQSGAEDKYIYNIKKDPPSSDAKLIKLEVSGTEPIKPVFVPADTQYKTKVNEGVSQITITPTASYEKSTIWIGDDKVETGKASEPINILEEDTEIKITVIAQDGKTKMDYYINVTNPNLIEKTNNADLASLKVSYGDMKPKFKPSITTYNVAVKDDAYSVDIDAETSDKYATMRVYKDSKEIGDERDNYSESIEDGENEFTIEVESSNGENSKEYTIYVNKEVKNKEYEYTPITLDDVNFKTSDDTIIIDITDYPLVSSEVFIEMRDKYPEKTLILEGNDYSFQFKGKELKNNIPHKKNYDFSLSFKSPVEEDIYDIIYDEDNNRDLDELFLHFGGNTVLPGQSQFSVNLGTKYGDDYLRFHYYNEDRERIDYYGNVATNNRGNFSVMLDHLGTYIVTQYKIKGSEDKGGGTHIAPSPKQKEFPNTGGSNN